MTKLFLTLASFLFLSACEIKVYEAKTQAEATSAPSIERIEMVPNIADSTIAVKVWARGGKIEKPSMYDASIVELCQVRCATNRSALTDWSAIAANPTLPEGPGPYKFSATLKVPELYNASLSPSYSYPRIDIRTVDCFNREELYTGGEIPQIGDTLQRYFGLGNKLM